MVVRHFRASILAASRVATTRLLWCYTHWGLLVYTEDLTCNCFRCLLIVEWEMHQRVLQSFWKTYITV